jgi:hypothetical protein
MTFICKIQTFAHYQFSSQASNWYGLVKELHPADNNHSAYNLHKQRTVLVLCSQFNYGQVSVLFASLSSCLDGLIAFCTSGAQSKNETSATNVKSEADKLAYWKSLTAVAGK